MDRAQFMQQLARLLSDISESERQEALDYYESYFDDAGEDLSEEVIRELGSPEKVASIIKADLKESNDSYAEYTERGYQDSRTREPGQMPDKYTAITPTGQTSQKEKGGSGKADDRQSYEEYRGGTNERRFGRDRARGRFEQAFSRAGEQMGQAMNRAGEHMDQAFSKAGEHMDQAFSRAGEQMGQAMNRAGEQFGQAMNRAGEQFDQARSRAGEQFDQARSRAGEQFDQARSQAEERFHQTRNHAEEYRSRAEERARERREREQRREEERRNRSGRHGEQCCPSDQHRRRGAGAGILLLILLVFAAPVITGAVGGILGVVITILLLPFLLIFAFGAAAIGILAGAAGTVISGINLCFGAPAAGILTIGVGCLLAALGMAFCIVTVWIVCRILPKIFYKIMDLAQRIFHRGRRNGEEI